MLAPAPLTAKARALPGLRLENVDHTVLGAIINAKARMLEHFVPAAKPETLPPVRSLKAALSGPGRHFILECKRASPSLGDINLKLDFDAVLNTYNRYAAAVSVLTEPVFFKGSYDYLKYVKAHTRLPVILKDFVLDEHELINARHIGADAVLLMTSVLSADHFERLYKKAYELGLEVLCEVSDADEAQLAKDLNCQIIGINNRNLKTLTINLNTARQLQPLFAGTDAILVSESGIKQHADLLKLKSFNNFLIGSAICGQGSNYPLAVKSLLFGLNKICGLKDAASVTAAIDAQAALGGLIFAPKSPRCVSLEEARALMAVDAQKQLTFCGVFLDAPADEVIRTVKALDLPFVQLHGHEIPEYIKALRKALPQISIIKAFAVKDPSFKDHLPDYQDLPIYFLFDSSAPGSGQSIDLTLVAGVDKSRSLLSGGLGPDNVSKALQAGFLGLDLNSRLETAPGHKDPALTAQVFSQINQY